MVFLGKKDPGSGCAEDRAPGGDRIFDGMECLSGAVRQGSCDLHLHTRFSDGADTVPALVQNVMTAGLGCFSVTDHDSVDAITEVISLLKMLGSLGFSCPVFIPGIELSADYDGEIHILGYFPYGGYERMEDFIHTQKISRHQRNVEMCECLARIGMPVTIGELNAEGDNNVGRLHAAKILVRKGYVRSVSEAFDNLFGYGMPCYVKRERPGAADAISCILDAGGVPVLAHPYLYKWTGTSGIVSARLLESLRDLKSHGLRGVEAFHGESTPAQQDETYAAAMTLGLIVTAGSDYHGTNKPMLSMYHAGNRFLSGETQAEAAAVIESGGKILVCRETGEDFSTVCRFPGIAAKPEDCTETSLDRHIREILGGNIRSAGHYATAFGRSGPENDLHILSAYRYTMDGTATAVDPLDFLSYEELARCPMPAVHGEILSRLREISLFDRPADA